MRHTWSVTSAGTGSTGATLSRGAGSVADVAWLTTGVTDLKALAEPVLAHRLLVTPEAQLQGLSAANALDDVLRTVPVPTVKSR